ncbi:MAG TPA: hypothetical protein VFV98_15130 [Vicinamibacterales bacterium]|nr:hypothetical protein [Vicinamibacterales bacterium]
MFRSGRFTVRAAALSLLLPALACGGSSPTAATAAAAATMTGEWAGTITRPNNGGEFQVRWSLTASGDQLGGAVTITKDTLVNPGTATGQVSGNSNSQQVSFQLRTQGPPPPGRTIGCEISVYVNPGSTQLPASTSEISGVVSLSITSCDMHNLANAQNEPVQIVLRK